jgi:protein TonB
VSSHCQPDFGYVSHRGLILAAITALHVMAIYVLTRAGSSLQQRNVPTIVQLQLIDRPKPPQAPPPPPPAVLLTEAAPVQVVAPQIDIAIPVDAPAPPLQLTPAPAPDTGRLRGRTAAAPDPRPPGTWPRALYVPGGLERYPAESLLHKERGTPLITVCIAATGAVERVQLTHSSGFPRLDQAALGIGRESRFEPATRDGKPVPVCMSYRVTFGINF